MRIYRKSFQLIAICAFFAPLLTYAKTFKELVDGPITDLGNTAVALIFALCILFFLFNIARSFFSTSEEGRKNGRNFAIWGIIALAVLVSTWGLVHVLLNIITDLGS